eukprot:SAG31_NODE_119_length_23948_cov_9.957105_9_plen_54_part_00
MYVCMYVCMYGRMYVLVGLLLLRMPNRTFQLTESRVVFSPLNELIGPVIPGVK